MLVFFCVVSQAQVNPKMSALFDQLTELEAPLRIVKARSPHFPARMIYYSQLYMYGGYEGQQLIQEKDKVKRQLAAVRQTLDQLQEEAQESYHYEYHKNGNDTIIYSLNLSADTTNAEKYQNGNRTTFHSDECLNFCYAAFMDGPSMEGMLEYSVTLSDEAQNAQEPYTQSDLTEDIARLFKQHKIKPRKSYWRHDKEYSDSITKMESKDFGVSMYFYNNRHDGDTEVTIYTLPEEQLQQARQLLGEVSGLAQKITNTQQDFYFNYDYTQSFGKYYWGNMLMCWDPLDSTDPQSYVLSAIWDDNGCHFIISQSHGNLLVPKDWYAIKTFVNGKKTYFKGMEPKEDKE